MHQDSKSAYDAATMFQRNQYKTWMLVLVFLAFTSLASFAGESPKDAPLVVERLGSATAALNGDWEFRPGDNQNWSSPNIDDSDWERLRVGRPWGDQGHYGYTGFAWYRRHLEFEENVGSPVDVELYIPHVRCAYQVYWNGNLIGHFGDIPAKPFFRFALPNAIGLGHPRSRVLAIRAWTAPLDSASSGDDRGMTATPIVGTAEAIREMESANRHKQAKQSLVGFIQMLILIEVVLIAFFAWVRNRDQHLLFWTVLFLGSSILTLLTAPLDIPWLLQNPDAYPMARTLHRRHLVVVLAVVSSRFGSVPASSTMAMG